MRTLAEAAAEAATCERCALAAGRTQVVYGVGDPHAQLMFIGEGPGFHEDKQGEPFVGAAGQLLNKMLGEIGISRADAYIANVVKCRPPGNRDPLPAEIDSCAPWLHEQVRLIDPKVVATLGRFAAGWMLGRQISITRIRGQRFPLDGRVLIPTLHPAAVLRGGGKQIEDLRSDFEEMRRALEEPRAPRAAPSDPNEIRPPRDDDPNPVGAVPGEPEPADDQLELF